MDKKWLCPELNEHVDMEECKACNMEMECGCCDFVIVGEAPYTCEMCGRIQIEIKNMGEICLATDTNPEEVDRIKKDATQNPNKYFRC